MTQKKKIIFIRHGESIANANGVFAGHLDIDLTHRGRMQAVLAALQIKHDPVDAIFSSPLKRAKHTAEYIAEHNGARLLTHPDLIERHLGKFEGMPYSASALEELDTLLNNYHAESLEELHKRAQRILHWLCQSRHGRIVLVSHGGIGRMLEAVLRDVHWQQYKDMPLIANAAPLSFEL